MFLGMDIGGVVKDAIYNGIDLITEQGVDFSKLSVGVFSLIAQILATIILFLIVRFKFWNVVTSIIDKRKKAVQDSLDLAKNATEEAKKVTEEANKVLEEARLESTAIIERAHKSAENESQKVMDEALTKIENEKARAHAELEESEKKARENIKQEITDVAFMLANKMISQEMDEKENNSVINEYLQGDGNIHDRN